MEWTFLTSNFSNYANYVNTYKNHNQLKMSTVIQSGHSRNFISLNLPELRAIKCSVHRFFCTSKYKFRLECQKKQAAVSSFVVDSRWLCDSGAGASEIQMLQLLLLPWCQYRTLSTMTCPSQRISQTNQARYRYCCVQQCGTQFQVFYAFFTKRNIIVDCLTCRYNAE